MCQSRSSWSHHPQGLWPVVPDTAAIVVTSSIWPLTHFRQRKPSSTLLHTMVHTPILCPEASLLTPRHGTHRPTQCPSGPAAEFAVQNENVKLLVQKQERSFFLSSTVSLLTCQGIFYLLLHVALPQAERYSPGECRPFQVSRAPPMTQWHKAGH